MLIIYRKSDGNIVANSGTNSYLPEGPPFAAEAQNAIHSFGGTLDDYGEYRLHDEKHADLVAAILAAGSYELVPGPDGAPLPPPKGVQVYPRIQVMADKAQVLADDVDAVTLTVQVGTGGATVELWVDGTKQVEAVTDDNGVAAFQLAFADPGQYVIEVRDTTPPPSPYFESRHGRTSVVVEVVQS